MPIADLAWCPLHHLKAAVCTGSSQSAVKLSSSVVTLIEHPARMTHASVAGSALEVPADLVRLSVGIEDCDDLIEDLRTALG